MASVYRDASGFDLRHIALPVLLLAFTREVKQNPVHESREDFLGKEPKT